MNIPQFPFEQAAPDARASVSRQERYGYVWVCFGEPMLDIPDLPQETIPEFRRIHQFDEVWNGSACE